MKTKLSRFILTLISISTGSMVISGCTLFHNDTLASPDKNKRPLPYLAKPHYATVYFIQPFTRAHWYMINDPTPTDAWSYTGSDISIRNRLDMQERYLGLLHKNTLCFYAVPGFYQLNIINPGARPKKIKAPIELRAAKSYFYALATSTHGNRFTTRLDSVSKKTARPYIFNSQPKQCLNFAKLSTHWPASRILKKSPDQPNEQHSKSISYTNHRSCPSKNYKIIKTKTNSHLAGKFGQCALSAGLY
ncbi:hypothetical protein [Piscirickettsia litoralis]|uniref:DUF2846 domain-containing protein n=1 Tax=Piscirickettsia litoralis TaxID=1891921 RepID=A0ABX2ZYI5_9GAMM|nr:hypothetical protein [Piscirickettsia litoralis]ODN41674.1 hypothetical protein BGC07_00100 [Piscirickettsia litoralis]